MSLRDRLIDIALEPSVQYRKDRSVIADATSTVSALRQQLADTKLKLARIESRLALAERHARQLNDEYALKYGAYP